MAIGEHIFDLEAALDAGLFEGAARSAVEATRGGQLNAFFDLGRECSGCACASACWNCSAEGSTLHGKIEAQGAKLLPLAAECEMHLPAKINDYTDFYVGIEHAQNVGKLFRPDNPLLPNYKYVPIGYHGRASTIRPSGTDVRRPKGQTLPAGQTEPTFGPCARLDYELELGIWIGQGNDMGDSIAIGDAADHIAGFCLLNDWSARDIQAWEYQPLGPFLSKSFITSISPWVVTAEALEPFRSCSAGASGRRSAAAAVPVRQARSGRRCVRHRAGSAVAHRSHARAEPAGPSPDLEQHQTHVLDGGADGRAPQRQRLPVAGRRHVRFGHVVGA